MIKFIASSNQSQVLEASCTRTKQQAFVDASQTSSGQVSLSAVSKHKFILEWQRYQPIHI